MKKNLHDLRKEIDKIDKELLTSLARRFEIVRKIGKYKKEVSVDPLDVERWSEVVKKITKEAEERGIPEDLIRKIYEEIHRASLAIETYE